MTKYPWEPDQQTWVPGSHSLRRRWADLEDGVGDKEPEPTTQAGLVGVSRARVPGIEGASSTTSVPQPRWKQLEIPAAKGGRKGRLLCISVLTPPITDKLQYIRRGFQRL